MSKIMPKTGKVYKMEDISYPSIPNNTFQYQSLKSFCETVKNQNFPCLFARKSFNKKCINFLFCSSKDDFLRGLTDFTNFVQVNEAEDTYLSPLVVFFDEDLYKEQPRYEAGWDLLSWVHKMDLQPWPKDVPKDPNHFKWSFCFNNVPLFINMSSGEHKELLNRNIWNGLCFIINSRANFDYIANLNTKSGRAVRNAIRLRTRTYNNNLPLPVELGFYGESDNLEWRQYQLSEINLPTPEKCPFKTTL